MNADRQNQGAAPEPEPEPEEPQQNAEHDHRIIADEFIGIDSDYYFYLL